MSVNESNTIQYTVVTSRVPDGTTLYWKTTGNTTNSDIVGGNTGSITVTNNRAVFNVTITADSSTDGTKELGINLLTGSLNGTSVATTPTPIVIEDTSQTPTVFPVTVDYLMVAGGGGGGYGMYSSSGGGGAGGLLQGTTTINTATVYTITIGAGGAGGATTGGSNPGTYAGDPGANGSNTIISGSDISTFTSWGGGGGGVYTFAEGNPAPFATGRATGRSGGSAGGSAYTGSHGTAFGSPGLYVGFPPSGPGSQGPQGYPGGPGASGSGGSGGGGATGRGQIPGPNVAGPGGTGYTWPIDNTIYAGGGGGGGPSSGGTGGPGGGGAGGPFGQQGSNGTANRGGGAGGSGPNNGNVPGASGGSGVVILAVPTPYYPGSAPGAVVTTPPAAPGKTVLTFNSSGTLTL